MASLPPLTPKALRTASWALQDNMSAGGSRWYFYELMGFPGLSKSQEIRARSGDQVIKYFVEGLPTPFETIQAAAHEWNARYAGVDRVAS